MLFFKCDVQVEPNPNEDVESVENQRQVLQAECQKQ